MKLLDAKRLAKDLMTQHGLKAMGWSFAFDNAVKRLGLCTFSTKTISISKTLTRLNPDTQVRNTLLHEIAHALIGAGHGHNSAWRSKAMAIGCNGQRCTDSVVKAVPKYKIVCGLCLASWDCFRRAKGLERSWHRNCGPQSKGRLSFVEVMDI